MIEVCLLGHGGMMPLPDRPLSAAAIRIGGEVVLFDCGEGTQVAWRASKFSFFDLGTILISHVHADHIVGLPGVLFQIALTGRKDPVRIIGPDDLLPTVEALMKVVGGLPFDLTLETLADGQRVPLVGDATVTAYLLRHRRPCLGYVVDLPRAPEFLPDRAREIQVPLEHWSDLQRGQPAGGFSPSDVTGPPRQGLRLSLVTDTAYFSELASHLRDGDLIICESTYVLDEDEQRAEERGHLTMRQATGIAAEANARRLWLTHFSPKVSEPESYAREAETFYPPTIIGRPGLSVELNFP
ncbi:MAG: ribonuclease Z [Thermomicrobiales bacterium]